MSYPGHSFEGVLPLRIEAAGVLKKPSWVGKIRQFVPEIYYSVSKKKNSMSTYLFFESCLDNKFQVREEILKRCTPQLEIPIIILKIVIKSADGFSVK